MEMPMRIIVVAIAALIALMFIIAIITGLGEETSNAITEFFNGIKNYFNFLNV